MVELRHKLPIKQRRLRSAGFVVLKNSNMTSILLEIGFLTNKDDARKIQSQNYQAALIAAIIKASNIYLADR